MVKEMSVISRKNQVTLPVDALREAGLGPGDDVRVQVLGPGQLALVRADDLVAKFAGVFDEDVYPEGYLDQLRREWP
jgi:bifunctional DNA-binding transcriptional regulator/antitoxin component of YhaV-PrlF toxin-antitoxin module